jgi:uncharacterized membrane protein
MNKYLVLILTVHILTSGRSVALLAARIIRVEAPAYSFLLGNLFLAWIPCICAVSAVQLHRWLLPAAVLGLLWLLFFPNALYLVTDFIHLGRVGGVSIWYDLIMFLCFALAGLLLGLNSLFLMQTVVDERAGRLAGWLFVVVTVGLAGYGIYLGRFLRWNSWDVFTNPLHLTGDMLAMLRNPFQHWESYFISAVFALIFLLAYVTIISLGSLQRMPVKQ